MSESQNQNQKRTSFPWAVIAAIAVMVIAAGCLVYSFVCLAQGNQPQSLLLFSPVAA